MHEMVTRYYLLALKHSSRRIAAVFTALVLLQSMLLGGTKSCEPVYGAIREAAYGPQHEMLDMEVATTGCEHEQPRRESHSPAAACYLMIVCGAASLSTPSERTATVRVATHEVVELVAAPSMRTGPSYPPEPPPPRA